MSMHRLGQAWSSQASEGFAVLRLKAAVGNFSFTCNNCLPDLGSPSQSTLVCASPWTLASIRAFFVVLYSSPAALTVCPLLLDLLFSSDPAGMHSSPKLSTVSSVTSTTIANQTARTSWQNKGSVNAEKELNDVLKYYLRVHFLYI